MGDGWDQRVYGGYNNYGNVERGGRPWGGDRYREEGPRTDSYRDRPRDRRRDRDYGRARSPQRDHDRRDRVRSRSRSHSRDPGRHRSRGRDRDRGRDRGRDRRSQERRTDRPSRSDDGPSPRSMTEVPIIAYADGGYEVKVSVPPDITVAALAAALYNAGMTPPAPVEYGSGAAVPTGPSRPGASKNPGLGAEGAAVKALPPGVSAPGLPPGVANSGIPPGVTSAAGLPPGVAGASTVAVPPADAAAAAAGAAGTAGSGADVNTQQAPSTVGSAPKLRHADNESMPPIRILDGKRHLNSWMTLRQYRLGAYSSQPVKLRCEACEMNAHRLSQRQKQVDFGKNTIGYERYLQYVPDITTRNWPHQFDTPDVSAFCSKRAFDGQIRAWRRFLHTWDEKPPPPGFDGAADGGQVENPMGEDGSGKSLFVIDGVAGDGGSNGANNTVRAGPQVVAQDYASDSDGEEASSSVVEAAVESLDDAMAQLQQLQQMESTVETQGIADADLGGAAQALGYVRGGKEQDGQPIHDQQATAPIAEEGGADEEDYLSDE